MKDLLILLDVLFGDIKLSQRPVFCLIASFDALEGILPPLLCIPFCHFGLHQRSQELEPLRFVSIRYDVQISKVCITADFGLP